jgi:hypothetical protein
LIAAAIVQIVTVYLAVGVVVGVAFLFVGIDQVDEAARGAFAFRPLLLPGLTLLWPYVVTRWLKRTRESV